MFTKKPFSTFTLAAAFTAMLSLPTFSLAENAAREVFIEQGQKGQESLAITENRNQTALKNSGPRVKPNKPSDGSARNKGVNEDFWIFDARTALVFDEDRDGYYTRLELDFDADTVFDSADVYAVLYLSFEGGPWNEYASTAVFSIFGATSDDEYFVDTDLVSGYPSGSYDVLIDLYDTFDDSLVASFGPDEDLDLYDLPLEDQTIDGAVIIGPVVSVSSGGGGGSAGLALLLMLAGGLYLRKADSVQI